MVSLGGCATRRQHLGSTPRALALALAAWQVVVVLRLHQVN